MICTSVIPCLSIGLAKKDKSISLFVQYFAGFFGHFECLAFFENGGTNLTPNQSNSIFLVNFKIVQQK